MNAYISQHLYPPLRAQRPETVWGHVLVNKKRVKRFSIFQWDVASALLQPLLQPVVNSGCILFIYKKKLISLTINTHIRLKKDDLNMDKKIYIPSSGKQTLNSK